MASLVTRGVLLVTVSCAVLCCSGLRVRAMYEGCWLVGIHSIHSFFHSVLCMKLRAGTFRVVLCNTATRAVAA